ncbi:MAG: type secretion system secreted protein VgrG [Acidobacteriota bacterium]|jgi:type VI secretion system secreted protein VgrG|nr:type secretion system secreted protein VgrG [Acidobacteriota bacterium]
MSATYTQDTLKLQITTPLGPDKLLVRAFTGEEHISRPFRFDVEMVSEDAGLDFAAIVGKGVTVTLTLNDGTKHHFHGLVERFVQEDQDERFTTYHAELRPWLWMLTKSADCRIFQNQTAPQIIKALFSELGFTDFRDALKDTYQPRTYCVQYNETVFNFVSRLMEDEGIFYFFEHTDGKHTLVLADDADAHPKCPGLDEGARYRRSSVDHTDDRAVTRCRIEQQVVTGKFAHDDFNFETPATDLKVTVAGADGEMQVYEYPGGFLNTGDGETRANRRIEAAEQPRKVMFGEGHVRAFVAGHKFDLKDHYRADANSTYVLRRISHAATQERYTNSFEAFPADLPFRPPRMSRKPLIAGVQTAIVTGKAGEEIWTDKYGRVKVLFHWDQKGKNDENSSCWIRVDQGWAGKQWGGIFLPRIGQEVVVSFEEGDPDRPVVTGAVYNAEQVVPYTLPDEQTKSTIKTNTSKGGSGFNELRFEDKKASEEVYLHAQKDHNIVVENDRTKKVLNKETNTIKSDRSTTIQEGNDTYVVEKGNRTFKVSTGNETYDVKGTRALTVTGNETHTDKADFTHKVTGNYELKVTGNLTIDVTGSVTFKSAQAMTHETQMSMTNKAAMSMTNEAQLALSNKGLSITNEAQTSITNKGNASNTVESSGVTTVKGTIVKIN